MKWISFALIFLLTLGFCSCGNDKAPVSVTITEGSSLTLVQGQQKSLSVTVANDPQNQGVTWTLTGTSCTGSACGTLTGATATSVTYVAPATVASNMTVTVTATAVGDTTKAATISINLVPPPSVTTTSLPDGVQDVNYSATLAATGGITPRTWSISAGTLPAGLTLSASTGVISGKPTTAETANFTVQVADSSTPALTATKALSIVIAPPPPLVISTTSLANGTVNTAYSATLAATGGTTPYTAWAVTAGSLPTGLTLHSATGVIDGTPTTYGSFDFTIQVTDSTTPPLNTTKSFTVVIAPTPIVVSTTSLPSGVVSSVYPGATLTATGGASPITWAVTAGALPAGLTLNGTTGAISGTPTTAGTFDFTVTATDSWTTPQTQTQALSIVVGDALAITTYSFEDATLNAPYTGMLKSSGGTPPVTWSIIAGSLPAGLTLDVNTGLISGTPTALGTASFTAQATDHSTPPATPQSDLTITVKVAPLAITTTSLPGATENSTYAGATLQATGGTPPVSWTLTAGTLPPGMSLSTAGLISGTPTSSGTFNFTVTATDSGTPAQTQSEPLSIVVAPALAITTTTLPDGTVNAAYTTTLASTGGTGTVTWSVSVGTLPAGLTLNSSTGVISGTPTTAGTVNFSIKATDQSNPPQTPEVALSITINPAPFVITTTTLSNGTIGTAYTATVQFTGGTPPITWAVTAGSLPAGLTLHSDTGVIDGTPTGSPATTNFTVTGTDSGSPVQTQSQALSITTVVGGVNNAELNGHYAFALRGHDYASGAPITLVGSFIADANGNITGGVEDLNSTTMIHTNLAITGGYYSVGADQRGTVTLSTSQGNTTFAFALGGISAGVASMGRTIETDSGMLTGSFKKQDTTAFSTASITGNYAFGISGYEGTNANSRFAAVGVMTANGGGTFTMSLDTNDNGVINQGSPTPISFSGTYSFTDAVNGRGLINDTTNGSHMAAYVISATELFITNIDTFSSSGPPLFTGSAQKQSGTFNLASMSGNVIFMSQSAASYSVSGVPNAAYTGLGLFNFNGTGTASVTVMDENDGGTLNLNQTGMTGTYTVASNGRMIITPTAGTMPEVFYLIGPGKAFSMGTNGAVAEGQLKPQATGPFNNASLTGNYLYGTETPVVPSSTIEIGVVSLDGSGNVAGTSDRNESGVATFGQTFTDTYSVATSGRVTLSSGIIYIIAPGKAVLMDISSGDTNPKLHMIDQ